MVDLGEFVVVGQGQVEMRLQSYVVGRHSRKILLDGDGRDDVDSRSDNVVLFLILVLERGRQGWSNCILNRFYSLELLLSADELERLGPVVFITIAHWRRFKYINIINSYPTPTFPCPAPPLLPKYY